MAGGVVYTAAVYASRANVRKRRNEAVRSHLKELRSSIPGRPRRPSLKLLSVDHLPHEHDVCQCAQRESRSAWQSLSTYTSCAARAGDDISVQCHWRVGQGSGSERRSFAQRTVWPTHCGTTAGQPGQQRDNSGTTRTTARQPGLFQYFYTRTVTSIYAAP